MRARARGRRPWDYTQEMFPAADLAELAQVHEAQAAGVVLWLEKRGWFKPPIEERDDDDDV